MRLPTRLPRSNFRSPQSLRKRTAASLNCYAQHTMEGYYGSPRHGGNRDAASWHMLGLAEPPLRGRAQYDLRTAPLRSKGDRS